MDGPLRILHVMRSPVGGLFRHVCDLAQVQAASGHLVGIVADATTGGTHAAATFEALAPACALGITRVPMARQIGPSDFAATRHVAARALEAKIDIVHGHGAKGGAYARLASRAKRRIARVYTPHGGSLHYAPRSAQGLLFLNLERRMEPRTDAALFESQYARTTFEQKVGRLPSLTRVVHNGLREDEFAPVAPAEGAHDFVFIGELRALKGVDVLLKALAILGRNGRQASAAIIGSGIDEAAFKTLAKELRIADRVTFAGAMPARAGFAMGRRLIVPSRAESLPYIVLEAAAAGVPIIASRVGGIPEILDDPDCLLVAPGDEGALARAMETALAEPGHVAQIAARLVDTVRSRFHVTTMAAQIEAVYRMALTRME